MSTKEVIEEANNNCTKRDIGSNKRVPSRRHILRGEIERLAVRKFKECGRGIQYSDVMKEFNCSKAKAQRILKYSCSKTGILTKEGHNVHQDPILFRLHKRTNPQTSYPRCLKADIIENLKTRSKNIDNLTGRNPLRSFFVETNDDYLLVYPVFLRTR